ncbi:ABC transporter substrate-binding protein [Bacillus glycinifermentans]|uniref:Iron siderophore-binding protein n=1 Tax=Bacillus glycinifermentans TaxID=1664069 RepID=A0A0T6BRN3_9BACI|nr:iron-siderophore ABC transporter substrate-binding protein [Bacillus glycinifermentans]ATH93074.1 iron-siderophore ABC transporter substrate-binding protein [Bacillus glycinifermentans]KRT94317.1 iron siderophore-binding protein [Bacillus glycinifermentans]MEC0485846.1 iron-siderophore ABC transporter substrate-binding protein [Bacillus glycinifermentans]MEC0495672.1 iron-siderophore ABC transporter substrate-binding protein [Bacillus glycinifermentans]MEC0542103.1 iron-siderophore ABC tran
MKKWLMIGFISMLTLSTLAACSGGNQNGSSGGKSKDTITVKHAMGTETKVPANPKRVVVLTNEGTEALLELGIKPVGAVKSWTGDPWYSHIKDEMKGVKEVGLEGEPNIEAIAELKPDLIIGNKMRQEKIYDKLSQIAPTVFSETLRGEWKDNFSLYAKAVNKEAKGKEVLQDFDKRVSDLSEKLGDKKKKRVSVIRFMAGQSRIYYEDSFPGIILKQLGFDFPDKQKKLFEKQKDKFAFMTESKESIPEMDGDVLFYFTYQPAESKKDALTWQHDWTSDPLWKKLNAVKSGNAHEVDDAIWTTAGGVKAANLFLNDIETYFLKS